MEPYKTLYPEQTDRMPITDAVCNRVLILPTGTAVSGDDIAFVCGLIRQTLEDRAHPARRCLA